MIVKPNSCTGLVLIVDVMKVPCTLTNHNDIDLPFPYNLVVVVAFGYSFFNLLLRSQTFLLVDGGLLGTAGWNSNGKDKVPDVQRCSESFRNENFAGRFRETRTLPWRDGSHCYASPLLSVGQGTEKLHSAFQKYHMGSNN